MLKRSLAPFTPFTSRLLSVQALSLAALASAALFFMLIFRLIIGIISPTDEHSSVDLGSTAHFPVGSITELHLSKLFYDPMYRRDRQQSHVPIGPVEPIPIFLVHNRQQGLIALYGRDTESSCQPAWVVAEQAFIDPCSGSHYTETGDYRSGPAPRSLDRFDVEITAMGTVVVHIDGYHQGQPSAAHP